MTAGKSPHVLEAPHGKEQRWSGREGSQEVRLGVGGLQLTHLCYHIQENTEKKTPKNFTFEPRCQSIVKINLICQGRRTEYILLNNVSLVYNL